MHDTVFCRSILLLLSKAQKKDVHYTDTLQISHFNISQRLNLSFIQILFDDFMD